VSSEYVVMMMMLDAGEFHLEITTNKRSETRKMFGTWCVFDNYGYLGDYIQISEFFIVNHALPGYWGFCHTISR
jgi:hypothetical protein